MSTTYRCSIHCPLHKSCFIVKTNAPVPESTVFLVKCPARKHDVAVMAKESKIDSKTTK